MLKGEATESPREEFVYFDDDGNLVAFRDERLASTSSRSSIAKGMEVWRSRSRRCARRSVRPARRSLRVCRRHVDPVEKWMIDRAFLVAPGGRESGAYLASYKDFPPRQRPRLLHRPGDRESHASLKAALMTKALIAYRSCCGWRRQRSRGPGASSPTRPRNAARRKAARFRSSSVPTAASSASASPPTTASARNGRCSASSARKDCGSPAT